MSMHLAHWNRVRHHFERPLLHRQTSVLPKTTPDTLPHLDAGARLAAQVNGSPVAVHLACPSMLATTQMFEVTTHPLVIQCTVETGSESMNMWCAVAVQASLAAQVRGGPIAVHMTSPGMVVTDLLAESLAKSGQPGKAARVVNVLAEEPRTVARWPSHPSRCLFCDDAHMAHPSLQEQRVPALQNLFD